MARYHWLAILWMGCGSAEQLAPTSEAVQELVFTPGCAVSGCHDATSQVAGLDLSSVEASLASLVEVEPFNDIARENGWLLVEPGSAERSFLMRKLLEPGVGEGSAMPNASTRLHDVYLELVAQWIEELP